VPATKSLRELYLTGQDLTSLGVTGTLFGGALTAFAILKRNVMGTIAKQGNVRKAKTERRTRNGSQCRLQKPRAS
jgi:hypothetical protein